MDTPTAGEEAAPVGVRVYAIDQKVVPRKVRLDEPYEVDCPPAPPSSP